MIKSYEEASEKFENIKSSFQNGEIDRLEAGGRLYALYYGELTSLHKELTERHEEDNFQFGAVGSKILDYLTDVCSDNSKKGEWGDD